jgi:hypothetical protein
MIALLLSEVDTTNALIIDYLPNNRLTGHTM